MLPCRRCMITGKCIKNAEFKFLWPAVEWVQYVFFFWQKDSGRLVRIVLCSAFLDHYLHLLCS
jgi:hypothetical protein